MPLVMVTGASGYIGRFLGPRLYYAGYSTRGCVRSNLIDQIDGYKQIVSIGDMTDKTNWTQSLSGVEYVVHLAARAHNTKEYSHDSLESFRKVNYDATINLARQSVLNGVRRFLYISSIGVLGSSTPVEPFSNNSKYNPNAPYAISKMEAEIELMKISKSTEMEVVILRPPLVYGPNAPGNFLRLLKLVDNNIFLPFGNFINKKSMISLTSLCDILVLCISAENVANKKFVISDGSDWSTVNLIRLIAKYMGKKVIIFALPISLLRIIAYFLKKIKEFEKLFNSLIIDSTDTTEILDWKPRQLPEKYLREAVEFYKKRPKP